MHDFDIVRLELDGEQDHAQWNEEENENEGEEEDQIFSEDQVQELAAELLSLSNEKEIDHFLGGLIKSAVEAIGKALKSPLGKQVGGVLKGVAKTALPAVGAAIGTAALPGIGTAAGQQLGSLASDVMGLELDGMSQEEQHFENAKQFVRLVADTAQKAAHAPAHAHPLAVARHSLVQAAHRYAPGLVVSHHGVPHDGDQRGHWVRRGRQITLFDV